MAILQCLLRLSQSRNVVFYRQSITVNINNNLLLGTIHHHASKSLCFAFQKVVYTVDVKTIEYIKQII